MSIASQLINFTCSSSSRILNKALAIWFLIAENWCEETWGLPLNLFTVLPMDDKELLLPWRLYYKIKSKNI